jgi:hypothetical protein
VCKRVHPRAFFGLKKSCLNDPSSLTLVLGLSCEGAPVQKGECHSARRETTQVCLAARCAAHQQSHPVRPRDTLVFTSGGHERLV